MSDGIEIRCSYCDVQIMDSDEDKWVALKAIRDHILNGCTNNICHTENHGSFTMIDGILFEEVIF